MMSFNVGVQTQEDKIGDGVCGDENVVSEAHADCLGKTADAVDERIVHLGPFNHGDEVHFHTEEENNQPQKKADIGQSRTARAAAKNLHEISTMLLFVPLNNSSGWQMRYMPQVGREVYQKLEAHSKTVRSSTE